MQHQPEEWKLIPGYEGLYSVSSLGRVRSDRRYGRTFPGKILQPAPNRKGYLQLVLCKGRTQKSLKVHAIVAHAFLGKRPDGFTVNHKSGDKTDNRVENLEYVSNQENITHAKNLGLLQTGYNKLRGEKCWAAKVNTTQIQTLRSLYATGEYSQEALGRKFGVSQTQVSRILRREKWKHI